MLADPSLQTGKPTRSKNKRSVDSPQPRIVWGPPQLLASDAAPQLPAYAATDHMPPGGQARPKKVLAHNS